MELKLKTDVGDLTAVLASDSLDDGKIVWVGWLKEYPGVIVQERSIEEALDKLPKILDMMLEVEIKMLMKEI